MVEAALRGSVGSVAILMRVLRGRVFLDVFDTAFLTPEWGPGGAGYAGAGDGEGQGIGAQR